MSDVVGYARVSTLGQAERGLSLDGQAAAIRAYCLARGLTLGEIIRDEGVSGSMPLGRRPGGARVLRYADQGVGVVACKLDRLFRSALDCLQVSRKLPALHLLDISVDTSTAAGRAFLQVAAAFAELERGLIGERTRDALRARREKGATLGRAPYGWRYVDGALAPVSEQQVWINVMRDLRTAGGTLEQIAAELDARGVPPPGKGGRWRLATIATILRRVEAGR